MTNYSKFSLIHKNNDDELDKPKNSQHRSEDHNNNNNNEIKNLNSMKNVSNLSKRSNTPFIVTEDFTEEDLTRPDVPYWYKDELINNDDDNSKYKNNSKVFGSEEFIQPNQLKIVWRNVFTMMLLHVLALYGWYLMILYGKWQSYVWAYFIGIIGGMGVLAGAHRLWTHRSYKAHWSLRLLLMICQTMALQNDIYEWVRDHRVHHKFSETDADPHNSRRGFFFAHVGWLLCRKHPAVKDKGSQIDMMDVWADPIVRFQRRFYIPLVLLMWGIIPVYVPYYVWNESLYYAFFGNFFRYIVSLHHAWLVNSAAHISGYRFYERTIQPRENYLVTYLSLGEGYHNYHHTFPWDYSASEHGWRNCFNIATLFIDVAAWIGLVRDRRIVSRAVVEKRAKRTGDLSIIPPLMNEQRKPISMILEVIIGILISSWPIWITFILNHFFHAT